MQSELSRAAHMLRLVLVTLLVAAALGGCKMRAIPGLLMPGSALATPAPLPPPGAFAAAPMGAIPGVPVVVNETYRLDSGDRVRIVVFGQDNLSRVYGVDGSGYISLPLIGPVCARGLTTFQLAAALAGELKRKYVKDPKVTAEVDVYRPFFILGEVKKPGQFAYVNGMSVETAVAIAEGYTERANERKVRLTRKFGGVMSTVIVAPDYPLQPGDTVYVLERFF
jgi:polysaccharide export outer membrane protein